MQQESLKTQVKRMTKKCRARLCILGLFCHSAVLSLPALMLCKVPNAEVPGEKP